MSVEQARPGVSWEMTSRVSVANLQVLSFHHFHDASRHSVMEALAEARNATKAAAQEQTDASKQKLQVPKTSRSPDVLSEDFRTSRGVFRSLRAFSYI